MYEEYKVIDGVLCKRTTPDGQWFLDTSLKGQAFNLLSRLNQIDREWVIKQFCIHCGSMDKKCNCWRDE